MTTTYTKQHKFEVETQLFDDELQFIITCHGRDHDMKTITGYTVDYKTLSIKRTGLDFICQSPEIKADIEDELYDNQVSLSIHSATWYHNLIHYAVTSENVEDFAENVKLAFENECKIIERDKNLYGYKVESIAPLMRRKPIYFVSKSGVTTSYWQDIKSSVSKLRSLLQSPDLV